MRLGLKNKILGILVLICLGTAVCAPMTASAAAGEKDQITIIYTNDIHTYIDNGTGEENKGWDYAKLAGLKNEYPDGSVLLVDAGDHVQGTAYGDLDSGETVLGLMKSAGYDLATPGNHEFDYGMERALDIVKNGGIPYVSSNFHYVENGVKGNTVLDGYQIFACQQGNDTKKVAFVGITTPELMTSTAPKYFQDTKGEYIYGIAGEAGGQELYMAVQESIDDAKGQGADYVIALGHLGVDESSGPWTSESVIANTTGLDAFIDGHSHTEMESNWVKDKGGEDVLLTQTGSYFAHVGIMTIDASGIRTELLDEEDAAGRAKEEQTLALQEQWIKEVDSSLGQVIGHTDVVLDNYDAEEKRLVRMQETNTGDFVTDALYDLFDKMELDVDVAIMNGGGIRNGAVEGDISYQTCKEIHPFGNVACMIEVTGQQLLDALEWGVRDIALDGTAESGGFLHVSGMTYEIHPYIASTVLADEHGAWLKGPTGEYRVKNVQIYDKEKEKYLPLDVNAAYHLAGYNYTLRNLGGGFTMFGDADNLVDYVMEDYMVLAQYIQSFPVDAESDLPTITKENSSYEELYGEGRIVILTSAKADDKSAQQIGTVWTILFVAATIIVFWGILCLCRYLLKKQNKKL